MSYGCSYELFWEQGLENDLILQFIDKHNLEIETSYRNDNMLAWLVGFSVRSALSSVVLTSAPIMDNKFNAKSWYNSHPYQEELYCDIVEKEKQKAEYLKSEQGIKAEREKAYEYFKNLGKKTKN